MKQEGSVSEADPGGEVADLLTLKRKENSCKTSD